MKSLLVFIFISTLYFFILGFPNSKICFSFSGDSEDLQQKIEAYESAIEDWKDELAKARKVSFSVTNCKYSQFCFTVFLQSRHETNFVIILNNLLNILLLYN